ncbi:MAG: hypothetical protein AUI09_02030 [Gemmatimonadetes bacterium 13_2_20CM_2_66_5]|nr:MAG: hypothetical protein AUI09_02030 [Gemmatimonadetes bacterium 13_2_20CM_2_66_5]
MLGRRDKQKLGFGVQADDPLHGGESAPQDAVDRGEPRQLVQLWDTALGREADSHTRCARQNLEPANSLRRLML